MKKSMKMVWVCMLFVCSLFMGTFSGEKEAYCKTADEKNAIKQYDKAAKKCIQVGITILNSWYFQVYEADDYYDSAGLRAYRRRTGIPAKHVRVYAYKVLGNNDIDHCVACISILESNLGIVHLYHASKGSFFKIRNWMKNGRNYTKRLPNSSKYKKKLKKYYSALDRYYDFVYDPSGSYTTLSGTLERLTNRVKNCRSALSW